jgi:hypothetical protein
MLGVLPKRDTQSPPAMSVEESLPRAPEQRGRDKPHDKTEPVEAHLASCSGSPAIINPRLRVDIDQEQSPTRKPSRRATDRATRADPASRLAKVIDSGGRKTRQPREAAILGLLASTPWVPINTTGFTRAKKYASSNASRESCEVKLVGTSEAGCGYDRAGNAVLPLICGQLLFSRGAAAVR